MTQKILMAVLEDPKESMTHRELNQATQKYEVVRIFTIPWPFHYGSLKDTYVDVDGDPLDIAVFSEMQIQIGQEMLVRIIGVFM